MATRLGSSASFVALWVVMMAAMMLPGAAPAVLRRAHASGRVRAVPLFVGSYLAMWTLVGAVVYAAYRPHGSLAAAAVAIAAGVYELTPLKHTSAGAAASASALDWSSGSPASAPASA